MLTDKHIKNMNKSELGWGWSNQGVGHGLAGLRPLQRLLEDRQERLLRVDDLPSDAGRCVVQKHFLSARDVGMNKNRDTLIQSSDTLTWKLPGKSLGKP